MKHRKQSVYSLIYHILPYRTNRYFPIFVIAMQTSGNAIMSQP